MNVWGSMGEAVTNAPKKDIQKYKNTKQNPWKNQKNALLPHTCLPLPPSTQKARGGAATHLTGPSAAVCCLRLA
jgi:hypothetical protein